MSHFPAHFLKDSDYFTRPAKYEYWSTSDLYSVDLVNKRLLPIILNPTLVPKFATDVRIRSSLRSGRRNRAQAFSNWDRINRKRYHDWQRQWFRKLIVLPATNLIVDQVYKVDLRNRVTRKKNALAAARFDELVDVDRLDRVRKYERGTLNRAETAITARKLKQAWQLDQSGNWRGVEHDEPSAGRSYHSRRHTRSNHIETAQINGRRQSSVGHDAAGNMTQLPQPGSPFAACKAKYDAWNRMTELSGTFGKFTYEYDGLGRRTIEHKKGELPRHFYHDQAGHVLTETLVAADGTQRLDREYLWDLNRADHLVCRIRHLTDGVERLFPLYDPQGDVSALINDEGDILERYAIDPPGNVRYLQANFASKLAQESNYDWRHYRAGQCRDGSGLYFDGGTYYHAALGRMLPRGPIDVLPESRLNAYVQDFPTGSWQPPHNSSEALLKWYNERSPWIKFGIGAVAMLIAVGLAGVSLLTGPGAVLPLIGSICGGLQGGIGAALRKDSDFGDIMLGAGIGALFGAICPWGGIGSLAGSMVGISIARATYGTDPDALVSGWDWGGLIGGVTGSVPYGLWAVAPELGGAFAFGAYGYWSSGGDWETAYHCATLGMMVGGIAGGMARPVAGPALSGRFAISADSRVGVQVKFRWTWRGPRPVSHRLHYHPQTLKDDLWLPDLFQSTRRLRMIERLRRRIMRHEAMHVLDARRHPFSYWYSDQLLPFPGRSIISYVFEYRAYRADALLVGLRASFFRPISSLHPEQVAIDLLWILVPWAVYERLND